MDSSSQNIILIGTAIYVFVMLLVGLLVSRKSASLDDFAASGRNMSLTVCAVSIIATWFGSGPMMGSAAAAYAGTKLEVLRATPNCPASFREEGRRVPCGNTPCRIASTSFWRICPCKLSFLSGSRKIRASAMPALAVFHDACFLPVPITVFLGLALVVKLLAFGDGYFNLGAAF